MPIGDLAVGQGFPLVPNNGDQGKVKYGAREINYTRDLIADLKSKVPTSPADFRTKSGITTGTVDPTGGLDGDIYFKTV